MHKTLRPFELHQMGSVKDTIECLSSYDGKAKVFAGGLDLISKMRRWAANPEALVSIQNISELDFIKDDEKEGICIGALTSLRSVECSPLIKNEYPLLHNAINQIASVQVKTMATVVGNLCVGTPASDVAPPLVALGAELNIAGSNGTRTTLLENFYTGVEETVLKPDEMVTEIIIPRRQKGSGGSFLRLSNTHACCAKVNGAVVVTELGGVLEDVKIVLGCVAPKVIRANEAEEILKGKEFDSKKVKQAAEAAAQESTPISDLRSTADYRREMVEVIVKRGLDEAIQRSMDKNGR